MPFKKGESGNAAGRPKGSVRKVGYDIRQNMAWLLQRKFGVLEKNFDKLDSKDHVRLYLAMMTQSVNKNDEIPFHKMDTTDLNIMIERTKEEFDRLNNENNKK